MAVFCSFIFNYITLLFYYHILLSIIFLLCYHKIFAHHIKISHSVYYEDLNYPKKFSAH